MFQWEKSLNQLEDDGTGSKKKIITAVIGKYLMEFITSLDYYVNYAIDVTFKNSGNIQFNISVLHDLDTKD